MKRQSATGLKWLWRGVAASLLLLLFSVMAVPIAAAQGDADDMLPACCRMAGAHGCSMRMHRAAAHESDSHQLASLSEHCPCPLFAPSGVATHDASAAASSRMEFALAATAASRPRPSAQHCGIFASDGDTRGPPSTLFA